MILSSDKVYTLDPLHDPRWPDFLQEHPNSSAFHARGWLRALQMTYGYEPVAFTTCPPSQELRNALLFCVVRSRLTGKRLVSLPFSDHCEPLVEDVDQFRTLAHFVESSRLKERWRYVELRSANSLLKFNDGFRVATNYYLHSLDLRPSLDALRKGFHKDCIQRKIRRAEREGLTYESGRSEALLQQFYGLLQLTRLRHHLPPQPIEWFKNLLISMEEDVCIRIASALGRPIGGLLTMNHGKKIVYKYGASDARFHHLGGIPMLFWEAIKEAKQSGAEVFDFGRSDIDNCSLIAFKERWSATRVTLTRWVSPHGPLSHFFETMKMRGLKEVCARLPDGILILAGRLLYRHIG